VDDGLRLRVLQALLSVLYFALILLFHIVQMLLPLFEQTVEAVELQLQGVVDALQLLIFRLFLAQSLFQLVDVTRGIA
jgi:hypothetical protein